MTANFWLRVQSQVLPLPVINLPALPQQNIVNTVGGGTVAAVVPIIPSVAVGTTGATGTTQNFGVSIF